MFNATSRQGVVNLLLIVFTNMGAFSTKRSGLLYPAQFHYYAVIPHWRNEREIYVKV